MPAMGRVPSGRSTRPPASLPTAVQSVDPRSVPIDREGLCRDFLALVQLDSPPGKEGPVARWCARALESLGARVRFDAAGRVGQTEVGNLHACLPGRRTGPPIVLNAHMDTVPEAVGVRPVRELECIHTGGATPLGADDKAGIAIILQALRAQLASGPPPRDVHVLLTVREEEGLKGSALADMEELQGAWGVVVDGGSVERLIHRAPAKNGFQFLFRGKKAHLTREPDLGLNAAQIAAQAVAAMPLGRIDPHTTASVERIESQGSLGEVPHLCLVRGEVCSLDPARLERATAELHRHAQAAVRGQRVVLGGRTWQAEVEVRIERLHPRLELAEDHPAVRSAQAAAESLGWNLQLATGTGGCDANLFAARGLPCVVLGTGAALSHTPQENIRLEDMARASTLLVRLLQLA